MSTLSDWAKAIDPSLVQPHPAAVRIQLIGPDPFLTRRGDNDSFVMKTVQETPCMDAADLKECCS